jgi:hypothetical protein
VFPFASLHSKAGVHLRPEILLVPPSSTDQRGGVTADQLSNFPFNPDSVIYSEANDVFGEENEHEITDPQQDREGLEPEEQNNSTSESLPPLDRQPGVSISDQVQASPWQPHVIEGDSISTSPIAVHGAPTQADLVGLTGVGTVPDSEPARSSMPDHTVM